MTSAPIPDPISVSKQIKDTVLRYIDTTYWLRDDDLRDRKLELPLDDQRNRATGHRVGGELVAVGVQAANAEEQRPVHDGPRVVREVDDVDRRRVQDSGRGDRRGESLELHG